MNNHHWRSTSSSWLTIIIIAAVPSLYPAAAHSYQPAYVLGARVRALMADTIVVGKVLSVNEKAGAGNANRLAEIEVSEVLKGKKTKPRIQLAYRFRESMATPYDLKVGATRIFFLRGQGPLFSSIDHASGTMPDEAKIRKEVQVAVKENCCFWKAGGGFETLLYVRKVHHAPGENINLVIYIRSLSGKPLSIERFRWPPDKMVWTLVSATHDGKAVKPAKPKWFTAEDVARYFREGKPWTQTLRPGRFALIHAQRINSAVRGYGYKEDVGFQYIPMTAPGKYELSAEVKNFPKPGSVLRTNPVTVEVR